MKGDYSARTEVRQNDEIGALAGNIDGLFVQLANVEEERKKLDKMRQDFEIGRASCRERVCSIV